LRSGFWNDFNSDNHWRFPDRAPWQIRELVRDSISNCSERIRAEWMWRRRPKLILGEGWFGLILVVSVGAALPSVPGFGLFLDVAWLAFSTLLIASDTVRLIRWRRDYEASLARLMRGRQRKERHSGVDDGS
jgi:hypothetical protein